MGDFLNNLLTSAASRAVQDILTTLAGMMAANGWFEHAGDDQKFIGSAFFLIMLALNHFTHKNNAATNAQAGALAVAPNLPDNAVTAIGSAAAKGKLK